MPRKKTPEKAEPKKIARSFRLFRDTNRRLRIAAAELGLSDTAYIETTLRERFKKEGIE
jgi:hypothetical protein